MKKTGKKYVAYYRVSTREQGISGLGLDDQKKVVHDYVGKGGKIVVELTEVASGSRSDRRLLAEAVEAAISNDAILIVAKLDRLGRNAAQLFQIRDRLADGRLYVCDVPDMDLIKFGVYATFAQYERERISARTKAALEARERRTGARNGNKKGTDMSKARAVAASEKRRKALIEEKNVVASKIIKIKLGEGVSLQKIADYLNEIGLKTVTGKTYTKTQVQSLIRQFGLKE